MKAMAAASVYAAMRERASQHSSMHGNTIMKNMLVLFGLLLAADCGATVYAGAKYDMSGPISGYLTGDAGACYVAISTAETYYADGYHYVSDPKMCALARATYLLRGKIRAIAEVRYGTDTNRITDFEVTRGGTPYWPPYHDANNTAHYALIGQVNGYLLVAGTTSCFASIKGNAARSNGYHEVKQPAHCNALLGAYLDGSAVTVSAEKSSHVNQITSVELSDDPKVYWPPYGRH